MARTVDPKIAKRNRKMAEMHFIHNLEIKVISSIFDVDPQTVYPALKRHREEFLAIINPPAPEETWDFLPCMLQVEQLPGQMCNGNGCYLANYHGCQGFRNFIDKYLARRK